MIINSPEKTKNKCQRRKRILAILLGTMLFICIIFSAELCRSNLFVTVTNYSIESEKVSENVRIGVISDLHSTKSQYKLNSLYEKLAKETPDIILLVGDIVSNCDTEDADISFVSDTVTTLCGIAPVYYSLGNHERFNSRQTEIIQAVESAGGMFLDNSFTTSDVNGNTVYIGGISYYRRWDSASSTFLIDFSAKSQDGFSLLLCHCPEFVLWGIENYNIDLVASGHTHGGMIKLPFAGALYAPEQGWFPKYSHGLYETKNGHLAITSGIGSSPKYLPRFLNPAEIMIIDVI